MIYSGYSATLSNFILIFTNIPENKRKYIELLFEFIKWFHNIAN